MVEMMEGTRMFWIRAILIGFVISALVSPVWAADAGLNENSVAANSVSSTGGPHKGGAINAAVMEIDGWKKNLSDTEKKLSANILFLNSPPDKIPESVDVGTVIKEMKVKKQIKKSGINTEEGTLGDQIYVYIQVFPGYSTNILDPYVDEIVARDEENHKVAAWVELSNFTIISNLEGVQVVSLVNPPMVNTGSLTTEGDTILGSDQVRALTGGPTGAGIKVGVISDGINHRSDAIATGDLPASIQVIHDDYVGDEGTAMCEIVYDIAPNSSIVFADWASNTISFAENMQDLADAGCNIIVDDIVYFEEPCFEDGTIAQKADALYASNILMVSSSGNHGENHHIGIYSPYESTNWHDFSSVGSASINPTPILPDLYAEVASGEQIIVLLQWNDEWGLSANDYDLYIYDLDTGDYLASSVDWQTGTQNPIELTSWTNDGADTDVGIAVKNFSAVAKTIEVYIFGVIPYTNNIVPSSSTFGHACSEGTISVAAVPVSDPGEIENFSSRGPRPISYPSTMTRNKPDITATDRNVVTGAGGFGSWDGSNYRFWGTSASAPHVAAIGALVWSKNTSLTAAQIRDALNNSAVDLGETGYDSIFGWGSVNATAAYSQLFPQAPRLSDHITIFRNGEWYVDMNKNCAWDGTTTDRAGAFGMTGDKGVTGDWDGDGLDEIGVFRNGEWYLDMDRSFSWSGTTDDWYRVFGMTGDIPVAGDWNNDDTDEIGVYRDGIWYFDLNGNFAWDGMTVDTAVAFGFSTDTPVVGDWNEDGLDEIGVFRNGEWYLDVDRSGSWSGTTDDWYRIFGMTGDKPAPGDWNDDGLMEIGVFRNGEWYLDMDRSFSWSGTTDDWYRVFGIPGDTPLALADLDPVICPFA